MVKSYLYPGLDCLRAAQPFRLDILPVAAPGFTYFQTVSHLDPRCFILLWIRKCHDAGKPLDVGPFSRQSDIKRSITNDVCGCR